ncbi:glycosyltransferase family 15 protein [Podospora didyma]|uniref:Glycosyltransferase family 15 protein n=1 Tax=Podospora didyma TaxID=330526 RepID=A0AAE0U7J9_9PEZI|nr:glycosyltransferase family 15 protein [Podospora didyma]
MAMTATVLLARAGRVLAAIVRNLRQPPRRARVVAKFALPVVLLCLLDVLLHILSYRIPRPPQDLDKPFATQCRDPLVAASQPRENATFVMLARNSDIETARQTIENIERQFNQWFHYPVLFINDVEWDPDFIRVLNTSTSGRATFHVVPEADWTYPEWVDSAAARQSMARQGMRGVYNGAKEAYHKMCRFYSGSFYKLEPLKQYKWYWRLEPDVRFTCAVTYDPFVEMARHGKAYGFTIALWEEPNTCPSLFRAVDDFRVQKQLPATDMWKAMFVPSWLPWPLRRLRAMFHAEHVSSSGDRWNLCHYWSNFEIADLDFFRGNLYQELYQHLDRQGGFWFERFGDAPVHSLAVHLLLKPEEVHHFSDIGYHHEPFFQCPGNAPGGQLHTNTALGTGKYSPESPGAIGCRCECLDDRRRNNRGICLNTMQTPLAFHRPTFLQRQRGQYPYTLNIP